jgi:hypothetical protein
VTRTLHQVEQHDGVGDHNVDQHRHADERGPIELAAAQGQGDEDADDVQRQRAEDHHQIKNLCYNMCAQFSLMHRCITSSM